MNKALKLILPATLISGIISGATLMLNVLTMEFGPGFLFGLATAPIFFKTKRLGLVEAFLWLSASVGSWYAALKLYFLFTSDQPAGGLLAFAACGALGAALLAVAYAILTRKLNRNLMVVTIAAGVGSALVMYGILTALDDSLTTVKFALSFAVWQLAVGIALSLPNPKLKP